ncbi:peptide/nickel transport system substrate-binding protein [Bosea psychrotolerans]|uniref:Peptide/nickel transport system substrate-binding protein n=2 Tax=Bosea psychrotolerans TaxID=1871628 RepID=A0A2S4MDJ3_9HYPH|nr:peptide/nickel transport system substrate-binding protein [Bosea psychrotolerans]
MRALAALVLGLTAFAATGGPASSQTLRTMLTSDIRGVMPGRSPDTATGSVLQNIYEGLVAWRADGSVAPMLAEKIDTSADGRTYVFTLRDGITFHNGAPLTAKEVVWTWERFLDPKSAWPCRGAFNGTNATKIESVKALDDHRVEFQLAEPSGSFLSAMARADCDSTGIAHPDAVDANGNWATAIGTGPFRMTEWRKGQFIELTKFADYKSRTEPADGLSGAKEAKLEKVRITLIPDAQVAKLGILQGQLDLWTDVDAASIKDLASDRNVTVVTTPVAGIYTIPLQSRDPMLADPRIRQAISHAIDRSSLAKAVLDDDSIASASLIPLTSKYYGKVQRSGAEYDPDKARALIKASGYKGERIVLITSKASPVMGDTAIYLQSMLQAVGLNVDVEILEFATQFERFYSGRYQMMVWNLTPYLDPLFIIERFTGDKGRQADKVWDSPTSKELLKKLVLADENQDKQALYDELHRLQMEEAPLVVWGTRATTVAFRKSVTGFQSWAGQKPRYWNVSVAR